ncbi:MAG: hypothetical protein HQM11_18605 [SAR324 cluster bacterium]|nr:hypothetical protein [SAR324 cluster bacterium]
MLIKYPSSSSYHFRIRLSKSLKNLYGKNFVQLTLNNGIYRESYKLDRALTAEYEFLEKDILISINN